jgi:hypothetical protein
VNWRSSQSRRVGRARSEGAIIGMRTVEVTSIHTEVEVEAVGYGLRVRQLVQG